MIPNRNDEPDLMAATRASGACSGIELIFNKIQQKKKKRGVRGGGSPPEGDGAPLSQLREIGRGGTFIKRVAFRIVQNVPRHAPL